MISSFRCYIDESGDEGFQFSKNSSEWFILSALITRTLNDLATVKVVDTIKDKFARSVKKHLHWRDLRHEEKQTYSTEIAKLPVKAIAICVHKPLLRERDKFQAPNLLYFYTTRYLMERASWLARDTFKSGEQGNGKVELIFSNRSAMDYNSLLDYFDRLRKDSSVRIHWKSVGTIRSEAPSKNKGLQLADACSGMFYNALEKHKHIGLVQPVYLQNIKPILYSYDSKIESYGFKVVPTEALIALRKDTLRNWAANFK